MGISSNSASGTGQYAQGYSNKNTSTLANRSRKVRNQYEMFDQELQDFGAGSQENLGVQKADVVHSVDAVSEVRPDDDSDKAILQTKTFTVRYD